jgi:secondary thiamine-phosphate synthase enzyme
MIQELQVSTHSRTELVNIDRQVQEVIRESGVQEGICVLWVPHTTAGITINENADPAVVRDIIYEVNKLIPFQDQYHHMEGNSAAHIKSTLFSPSLTIIIKNGRPVMGTWQSIYFCEFDGPRHRHLIVKVLEG